MSSLESTMQDGEKVSESAARDAANMPAAIQSFYAATIEDIRSAKEQQWKFTYYELLLLGAVYVIYNDIM